MLFHKKDIFYKKIYKEANDQMCSVLMILCWAHIWLGRRLLVCCQIYSLNASGYNICDYMLRLKLSDRQLKSDIRSMAGFSSIEDWSQLFVSASKLTIPKIYMPMSMYPLFSLKRHAHNKSLINKATNNEKQLQTLAWRYGVSRKECYSD